MVERGRHSSLVLISDSGNSYIENFAKRNWGWEGELAQIFSIWVVFADTLFGCRLVIGILRGFEIVGECVSRFVGFRTNVGDAPT